MNGIICSVYVFQYKWQQFPIEKRNYAYKYVHTKRGREKDE